MSQNSLPSDSSTISRMPVLFIGHGSPLNALAENSYTKMLSDLAAGIPRPKAILSISAHWMTRGTWITAMERPRTIHDFYGFPRPLFEVQYPAPGSPKIAEQVQALVSRTQIHLDNEEWGLDHGTWAVLKHMYPAADIPVLQLSLSVEEPPEYHLQVGQQLESLRDSGVLILGSGNLVHNLRMIVWNEGAKPYDWALEFDMWIKAALESRDFEAILHGATRSPAGQLSVPTVEHFLPLLYVMGASSESDRLRFEFEAIQNASISMRSLSYRP